MVRYRSDSMQHKPSGGKPRGRPNTRPSDTYHTAGKRFGKGGKLSSILKKLQKKYKGKMPSKPKPGRKVPRGKFIGSRGGRTPTRGGSKDMTLLKKKFGASRKRYAAQGNRELTALKLEKSKRGRPTHRKSVKGRPVRRKPVKGRPARRRVPRRRR